MIYLMVNEKQENEETTADVVLVSVSVWSKQYAFKECNLPALSLHLAVHVCRIL